MGRIVRWLGNRPYVISEVNIKMSIFDEIQQHSPLPEEALYLGTADDGLPLLDNLESTETTSMVLHVHDPSQGTRFLRRVVDAINIGHPQRVSYAITTPHPEMWDVCSEKGTVLSVYDLEEVQSFFTSLGTWIKNTNWRGQTITNNVLLLIEDLDEVFHVIPPLRETLSWIRYQGGEVGVWVIATSNTNVSGLFDTHLQMSELGESFSFHEEGSPRPLNVYLGGRYEPIAS